MVIDIAAIAQQTTPTFQNASSGMANSFGSSGSVLGVAAIIALVVIGLLSSARFYKWALAASGRFATSFEYAIKGVVTAAAIGVLAAPVYLLTTMDSGTRSLVYRGAAVVVLAYVGLVILGFIGERVWQRVIKQHEAATGSHPLDRFRGEEEAGD